jgi:hypothetical protein
VFYKKLERGVKTQLSAREYDTRGKNNLRNLGCNISLHEKSVSNMGIKIYSNRLHTRKL